MRISFFFIKGIAMTASEDDTIEMIGPVLPVASPPDVTVDFQFGAATHVGLRRTDNEDHFAVVRRTRSRQILLTNIKTAGLELPQDDTYVMVVADGIGGAAHGELASELILRIGWELTTME